MHLFALLANYGGFFHVLLFLACKFLFLWGGGLCATHVFLLLVVNLILHWFMSAIKTCILNPQEDMLEINQCNIESTSRGEQNMWRTGNNPKK